MKHPVVRTALFTLALASALASPLRTAHAGGFEYADNGSVAFGRGGAFVTRASDPTALAHNVAGIVGTQGVQVTLAANAAFLGHCFARAGNYDVFPDAAIEVRGTRFENSEYHLRPTPYPEVCNEGGVFIAPHLLATWRINDWLAIGAGVYGPSSVGNQRFPDVVNTPNGLAPSPIRSMMLREDLLIIHPTLAAAVQPWRWLRVGVAVQPSYARIGFAIMANGSSPSAQSPDTDVLTEVEGDGFFLAGNLGVQVVLPQYVSFGAQVHYNPETVVLRGRGVATANYYAAEGGAERTRSEFSVDRFETALPLQIRAGARFAMPRDSQSTPQDAPGYDPMKDDRFDVEITAIYERSSAFRALVLDNSGNVDLGGGLRAPVPDAQVPHHWRDVFGVRLGGDYNVIRDVFTIRGGVSFDQGAMSPGRAPPGSPNEGQPSTASVHIDLPAYDTLGLHLGASVRWRFLTFSAGYAHFFMSGVNATEGSLRTIGTFGMVSDTDCAGTAGPGACQNNRGVYRASLDVLNLGITARF